MKKKGLKIAGALAGIAALAALTPYSIIKDEDGKTTISALLWKYTNQPDPEAPSGKSISIDIGFHNPFKEDNDHLLMDDEDDLILLDSPDAEEPAPCDIELTLEPQIEDEPVELQISPEDYQPEV